MKDKRQQAKRKRGGQKGNQNARTHGKYSRVVSPHELEVLKLVFALDLHGQRLVFAQLFKHLVKIERAAQLESHSFRPVPEKAERIPPEDDFDREFAAWAKERNIDNEDFRRVV